MNASVCLASNICSQVYQQEHVTQMQLTQINIIMEGHEDIRIPVQVRMIPWYKIEKPIHPNLFFKALGFAEWNRLTCKKENRC